MAPLNQGNNPAATQGKPGANPRVSGDQRGASGSIPAPVPRDSHGAALDGLRVRVRALRDAMQSARVDYLRARLELALATGHKVDADRLTRQLRNVLNEERPKAKKRRGAMPTHSGRTANADQQTNKAACAAKE